MKYITVHYKLSWWGLLEPRTPMFLGENKLFNILPSMIAMNISRYCYCIE